MAAQARHYESKSIYSSRQSEEKIISKNHRHNSYPKQLSRDSSPYRIKSNTHSSPIGRKRAYDSPTMKHGSPYENRKRERVSNDIDSDWSQHVSSSGKIYYYNKRTEESQWEIPKDWTERDKSKYNGKDKYRDYRSRNSRDDVRDDTNNKDYNSGDSRDSYRYKDKKDYRDSRTSKDSSNSSNSSNSSKDRNYRDRERDRDSRDSRENSNSNGKYKLSGSSRSSVKSIGQVTPSSYTSSNNRYNNTPESVNGTVQDISPPGTPTNDDNNILNISGISNLSNVSQSPAMFTPHGCSPLLNASLTALASQQLGIPTAPHNPIISPNMLNNSTTMSPNILHPLQQALLLQQQLPNLQINLNKSRNYSNLSRGLKIKETWNKELYGSPKLPTVKNHFQENTNSAPSSPVVLNFHQNSVSMIPHSSPSARLHLSNNHHSNSPTPPPPPPPPKDQHVVSERERDRDRDRDSSKYERHSRNNSSYDSRGDHYSSSTSKDNLIRSKSYDTRVDDQNYRHSSQRATEETNKQLNSDRNYKKSTQTKITPATSSETDSMMFNSLPELEKYGDFFSNGVLDFTNGFVGNSFDKQATDSWNDAMSYLHGDGERSKYNSSLSCYTSNHQYSKIDVFTNWYDALNEALEKVESLRDSNMSSNTANNARDYKTLTRKSKQDSAGTTTTTTDTPPDVNGIKCDPLPPSQELEQKNPPNPPKESPQTITSRSPMQTEKVS